MSRWTTAKDLRQRLQKEWDRGRILSARLTGETLFPYRIPLKYPAGAELAEHYDEARDWLGSLESRSKSKTGCGYSLEWREVNHRQLGRNKIPVAAVFEEEIDGLCFIGKRQAADRFQGIWQQVSGAFAQLRPWLLKKPLPALHHDRQWPKLLAVIDWLRHNPRPGLYIRQLEIKGVDTKFIEQHKKLLAELLDLVLPQEFIDQGAGGVAGFEQRYGFLAKPAQIRFRLLDPALFHHGLSDLQIPVADFARLAPEVRQVFITENSINGLSFPAVDKAMVIFGLGYDLDSLAGADWLADKKIYYWGDIDTHGFAMLDQLRSYFPRARSLLMDRATLMDHKSLWGREKTPMNRELPRLNDAECKLYDDLLSNRLADALRLEQERITYTHLKKALKTIS